MTSFLYKATTREGRIVEGVMDATGKAGVISALRADGYIPLSVAESGAAATAAGFTLKLPAFLDRKRVRPRDVMLFTRELTTLLEAGLPLDRSLQSLSALTESAKLKHLIGDVLLRVQQGCSLSEALAEHPEVFSSLYVNMVRAGEAGGVLDTVLARLADYLERSEETRQAIRSQLPYPIVLLLVGSGAIIVLLTYVLPKFTVMFDEIGATLPASTRLVMGASDFLQSYWWVFAVLAFGLWAAFQRYVSTEDGRAKVDGLKLKAPLWGELLRKIQVARFARTLGTMLKCGVPLLQSLDIVCAVVENLVISRALVSVQKDVSEGKGLAKPLEDVGVFPSLALQMVTVGEETGRLDEMLLVVSEHYDREVENALEGMMSMLGPVILVLVGIVAGFIMLAMMSAVFSINQLEL